MKEKKIYENKSFSTKTFNAELIMALVITSTSSATHNRRRFLTDYGICLPKALGLCLHFQVENQSNSPLPSLPFKMQTARHRKVITRLSKSTTVENAQITMTRVP